MELMAGGPAGTWSQSCAPSQQDGGRLQVRFPYVCSFPLAASMGTHLGECVDAVAMLDVVQPGALVAGPVWVPVAGLSVGVQPIGFLSMNQSITPYQHYGWVCPRRSCVFVLRASLF